MDKCYVCKKDCNDFYLQKGKVFCDKCFMAMTNKMVKYKIKMQRLNKALATIAYVLALIFVFVFGIAVGMMQQ